MKFEIFKFKNVTSTNDIAINLIREKNKEAGCVCAEKQTKGRGTHGKKWISNKGNLFGSIFFPLEKDYPKFNEFSLINPIIISNVIGKFCNKKKLSFKWPNDILINKKKICGILQELITLNGKKFLIIGIGLNVLTNPKINAKYKATNIFAESRKRPKINKIIKLIIVSYENFFLNLDSYNYENFKKEVKLLASN
tara:strand:- start:137 stop:721 length:585 start_codon:yes stop_codon:yes gene_type:complete